MYQQALRTLSSSIVGGNPMYGVNGFNRGQPNATNINRYISRVQFERLAHDIGMWRDAIREAELAFYPSRVKMQRMYMDTLVNGYVKACYDRWKELTTQRDYEVYKMVDGEKQVSQVLSQALTSQSWFDDYIEYVLEAPALGYSLISLGDIVNDGFPNITTIRRENIRPDGLNGSTGEPILTSLIYANDGIHVTEDPLIDMCNHWIPTRTNRGVSNCGYGFLYEIALYEIHLKHILEWNVDFTESYAQPIKVGSTRKIGKERKNFEDFLRNGASNQWVLLDKGTEDSIDYKMAESAGTAWKSYDNLEKRLQGVIAQLILGHENAIKETAGKLGGMQQANKDGFNESLTELAMGAKQMVAGDFVVRKINEVAAPKFRKLGKYVKSKIIQDLIPEGYMFGLKNDKEEARVNRTRNAHMLVCAEIAEKFNKAGLDVDPTDFGKWTGLKLTPSIPETTMNQNRNTTTTTLKVDDPSDLKSKQ